MKAAYLVRKGDPHQAYEVRNVPDPEPAPHEVLIDCEAFGLNFADVMARQGLYREAPPMPCIVGYEVVGKVVSAGEQADPDLIGKRVMAFTRFGGYGQKVATDTRAAIPIGDMDAGKALALTVQYCTAQHCIQKADLMPGAKVLVHAAAGGVGTALTQLAKLKGCEIYGTVGSDEKMEIAKANGVDHPVNYRKVDYQKAIEQQLNGDRLYATFNAVGGKSFRKDMRLLGHGGTIVSFGAADRSGRSGGFFANLQLVFRMGFFHPLFLMMRSQTVAGVNMLKVADHYPEILQKLMEHVLTLTNENKLNPQVGGRFDISELGKAHELLESRKSSGKIIVTW